MPKVGGEERRKEGPHIEILADLPNGRHALIAGKNQVSSMHWTRIEKASRSGKSASDKEA